MTKEGGNRPHLTIIPGDKPLTGELSGAGRAEIVGQQAAAFLARFQSFREAHPINLDLTPASRTYRHVEAMRGDLIIAGDEEGSDLALQVSRGLLATAFPQFSPVDKLLITEDFGIQRRFFARSMNRNELGTSLNEVGGLILQSLLTELNIPFRADKGVTDISHNRFIWEMRKVAVEHHLFQAEAEAAEGELTLVEVQPPNVTSMEGRTRRNR